MGISCKGILDPMSDYLHGEAGDEVCREIEEHLRGCENCRIHVDNMKLLITLYKPWKDDGIPDDVSVRLREVIAREARKKAPGQSAGRKATRGSAGSASKAAKKPSRKPSRGSTRKTGGKTSKKKR